MKLKAFKFLKYFWGFLYLITAVGKLLDNRGFAEIIESYQVPFFEGSWLLGFALAFSLFELFIAYGLLWIRNSPKYCYYALNLMNAMYLIMVSITYFRGIELQNCGCFGVFWARPLTFSTIIEDSVFLASSLILMSLRPENKKTY